MHNIQESLRKFGEFLYENVVPISVLTVLVGSIIWWIPWQVSLPNVVLTEPTERSTERVMREEEGLPVSGTARLIDLYQVASEPQECTFTYRGRGVLVEGTAFVVDAYARVEAYHNAEDGWYTTHYIVTPDLVYAWRTVPGEESIGRRASYSLDRVNTSLFAGASPNHELVRLFDEVTYQCREWNVDRSVFEPPVTVQFIE